MDKQSKHSNNSLEKYLKYFKNLLSGRERHALEKDMMRDPFEEEAYEGLSRLSAEEFSKDIAELEKKLEKRTHSRKLLSLPILRYAAAAVLILSLGTLVILIRQSPKEASKAIGQKLEKDTSLNQKPPHSTKQDSLNKNIAYQPGAEKESVAEQTIKVKVEESEAAEPSIIKPSTEIQPVSSGMASDIEPEETEEAEQYHYNAAEEAYADEVTEPEVAHRERSDARKSASSKKSRVASPVPAPSEKNTITGRVLSASDEAPLPGVTVQVKGTTIGTVSDIEGNFSIEVPANDSSVLQFAYLGYATEEMKIDNINNITVAMNEDLIALDEVVVVGYGTMKRTSVTGAMASVKVEEVPETAPLIISTKPAEGFSSYKQYIRENTRYKNLPDFDKPVTVKLNFRVSENGTISGIVVEKSEDPAFNNEAIRLVREGPSWLPGTENGRAVSQEVTLKVKFQPEKDNE